MFDVQAHRRKCSIVFKLPVSLSHFPTFLLLALELKQTSPHISNFQSIMSMSSTPKKRPRAGYQSPKHVLSTSSTIKMEPPPNLFPSKQEFLRLVAVLAIAYFVALTCNFIANYINPTTKPFCDSNPESTDTLYGALFL